MNVTGGLIVVLALGLGLAEAVRAFLARTRLGTSIIGRVQSAHASSRLDRFGQARTVASATAAPPALRSEAPDEALGSDTTQAIAEAIEEFGNGEDAPALLRLTGPGDLAQLARTGRRGDLWLRLNDFESWPDRGERRQALIEAMARHPEWDDAVVYDAAIALALWENDGAYGVNRARNRKRVRRLRDAVSRDLVYLDEVRAERDAGAAARPDRGHHTAA
jgi:hypothetical protein